MAHETLTTIGQLAVTLAGFFMSLLKQEQAAG